MGYTPYAFSDKSRDTFSAIDVWTLELEVIPKDTKLRNYLLFDYGDARKTKEESLIPALGSRGQVIGLRKNQDFLDTELLFVPVRLLGRRFYRVPESEIDLLRDETHESEDSFWQGEIKPDTPVRALMDRANPRLEEASHPVLVDEELTAKSEVNANPRSEDIEQFFKPIEQCNRYDCALEHNQVKAFVREHNKANKKAQGFVLLGRRFDDKESIKFDHLKGLQPLIKQFELLSKAISINQAIWDSWDQMDTTGLITN